MSRPAVVIAVLAVSVVLIGAAARLSAHGGQAPHATPVRSVDLVMQDEPDGSIRVLRADDSALVQVIPPATNGFLRVILAGQVRERRREGDTAPDFHLTEWSDGRLTLDDSATHSLIELRAFGADNAAAFARLLGVGPGTAPTGVANGGSGGPGSLRSSR